MKKIFVVLMLASLLQGCIAVGALAVGGVAGGAVASDKRSFSTMADDQKISYNIQKQLAQDPEITHKNSHIIVVSYNHVVLLVGQVPTQDISDKINQVAQNYPNVRRVFNELTVGPPTSAARRSKDVAITANVKTRLFTTTNVSSGQVKVITENGVVYLLGITSRDRADAAAQVARNSTGVQEVVKLIEYIND